MTNDNAIQNRRKSDRRRAPRTPQERVSEKLHSIMEMQDPKGLTPAEATEQAIPDELFGGSEIVISLIMAGAVGVIGLVLIAVWQVLT